MGRREHLERLQVADQLTGQRVDLDDPLHLIAVELHPGGDLIVGRLHVHRIAPDPEAGATEVDVVALELEVGQLP